ETDVSGEVAGVDLGRAVRRAGAHHAHVGATDDPGERAFAGEQVGEVAADRTVVVVPARAELTEQVAQVAVPRVDVGRAHQDGGQCVLDLAVAPVDHVARVDHRG